MTNKLKDMNTMSAGVTASGIEQYDPIVLHGGRMVKVIVTDPVQTIVQYENGAQRVFSTPDLAGFRELGTFPSGTEFYRRTAKGEESLFIEHITPDTYIVEMNDADGRRVTHSMSYTDLMAWHDGGDKVDPNINLVPGTHLYVPKTTVSMADVKTVEAAEPAAEANPTETDLQVRIKQLEEELAAAEVNGQARINKLMKENRKLNADLLRQHDLHVTELLAKKEQIRRIEEKAAILNPAPVCKEYRVVYQSNEAGLEALSRDGWQIQHMQFVGIAGDSSLNVVFFRDLPAAPKVAEVPAEASRYVGAISSVRPPVQRPPMPAGQTIIQSPVSRALTHNGPKPGETKRIPSLADIQARRERDDAEIGEIMQRGLDAQEAMRRQFAQAPARPFGSVQGANPR
ncbi:MAG: hypothetical protein H0X37_26700 [Herpetosiphonaceae bacterium]|nr:hypothetical protein [Herpetosiphonaceae bacterium]